MNKLVLIIIFSLIFALGYIEYQEDYKVIEQDISFTEQERAEAKFYHNYHGILHSYENLNGEWVFERNGKICKAETKPAKESYRRRRI